MAEEQDDLALVYMWAFKKGEESAIARVKELETAICDWCDAIVDMEGVDFVEYIKSPTSQNLIMDILDARDAQDMEKRNERI